MNWTVYADGEVLARSVVSDPKFQIVDPRVTAEVNKAGTFEFTIYPEHPYYDKLFKMKTLMRVELNDETIFDGRVLYTQTAMNRSRKVYCEGVMAYLLDSIQESHEYNANTPQYYDMTVADYVDQLLVNHNLMFIDGPAKDELANYSYGSVETAGTVMSQFRAKLQELLDREVETGEETIRFSDPEKIIYTGTVNAVGSAGYGVSGKYKFEVTGHSKTLDVLQNTLVETIGGYMRVQRRMNAGDTEPHLYLDWTNNFDGVNTQSIDFGVNMLDFTMDESGVDVFTRLYPTGKPSGSSNNAEVIFYPSENGAKIIGIMENEEDQEALEDRYGVIVRAVEFSDCDNAETLKKLVWNYIERYAAGLPDKLSLTALDLRSYGVNILQMGIGRKLTANARRSHGLYRSDMTCISIDYYLRAPDKNIYVLSSAPTGADATPKFSAQQSTTASTASSARRSASSAARTAETAQTAASTAVEVSNTTKTEVGDVEQLMYYIAYSNGVDIGEGEGAFKDYKNTFVKAYAQALGIAIDPETGEIARDIDGNFAFDYSLSNTTGNNANRVYSAFEAKADKATLISEINASAFQSITFDAPLNVNPQEFGYYEKDARGNYVLTADQTPVTGKTYYERSSQQVISHGAVEATPGGVLIDAINNASNKTIDYSKVQVQPKSVLIKTINGTSEENAISGSLIDLSNQGTVLIRTINGDNSDRTVIDSSKVDVNGILSAAGLRTDTIVGPVDPNDPEGEQQTSQVSYGNFYQLNVQELDVSSALFFNGANVANAVTGFGSASYTTDGGGQQTGEVKIPYTQLGVAADQSGYSGYITFNMANTSFFQTQMALARAEGAAEAGASGNQYEITGVSSNTLYLVLSSTYHEGTGANAGRYFTNVDGSFNVLREREYTDDDGEPAVEQSNVGPYTTNLAVDITAIYAEIFQAGENNAKGMSSSNPLNLVPTTSQGYNESGNTEWSVDLGGYYFVTAVPKQGNQAARKLHVPEAKVSKGSWSSGSLTVTPNQNGTSSAVISLAKGTENWAVDGKVTVPVKDGDDPTRFSVTVENLCNAVSVSLTGLPEEYPVNSGNYRALCSVVAKHEYGNDDNVLYSDNQYLDVTSAYTAGYVAGGNGETTTTTHDVSLGLSEPYSSVPSGTDGTFLVDPLSANRYYVVTASCGGETVSKYFQTPATTAVEYLPADYSFDGSMAGPYNTRQAAVEATGESSVGTSYSAIENGFYYVSASSADTSKYAIVYVNVPTTSGGGNQSGGRTVSGLTVTKITSSNITVRPTYSDGTVGNTIDVGISIGLAFDGSDAYATTTNPEDNTTVNLARKAYPKASGFVHSKGSNPTNNMNIKYKFNGSVKEVTSTAKTPSDYSNYSI